MPDANVFSWEGETVFIPLQTIKKISIESSKKISAKSLTKLDALNNRLIAAEEEDEDATSMEVLMPFGETLSFIIACIKGRIGRSTSKGNFFFATDGTKSIVMSPSFRNKPGYFISDITTKVPQTTMPRKGFPKIEYDQHLPNKVKDFMVGFFSDGMHKLTTSIDDATSQERNIGQIAKATSHKHYVVFGYLIRRLLCEKTVKYRMDGIKVFWGKN